MHQCTLVILILPSLLTNVCVLPLFHPQRELARTMLEQCKCVTSYTLAHTGLRERKRCAHPHPPLSIPSSVSLSKIEKEDPIFDKEKLTKRNFKQFSLSLSQSSHPCVIESRLKVHSTMKVKFGN